jgi:hypothetical protein
MKRLLASSLLVLAVPASYATDVGVSIGISQPGVYGRVDIGRFPQPAVIVSQPVIIAPPPRTVVVQPQPVYLWVPPGHRKKWAKHCHEYNACGHPVYFVRDDWYEHNVRYADNRGQGKGHGKGKGKGRD